VREDDARPARLARPTFGSAASELPSRCIARARQRGSRAGAVVRADAATSERGEPSAASSRSHAAERLAVASKVISATIGSDETARTAPIALELVQVEERLDHEAGRRRGPRASAPAREELACSASKRSTSPSGPIEPAMKTSRPDTSRASRASRTPLELIRLEVVLQEVRRELAAVGAEGVRLDQLCAGAE
jgi:hypothetical protein